MFFLEISLYKKDHYLTLCMIDLLSIGLPVLAGTLFVVLFMVLFNWLGPKLLYTTWLPIKTVCTILIWHYVSHLTDMEVIHPLQVSIAVGIPYAFFVLGMILVPRPYTLYASFPIFILTCVPIYWVYNNVIATSIYTGLYIIALVIAILLGHSGRFAERKKFTIIQIVIACIFVATKLTLVAYTAVQGMVEISGLLANVPIINVIIYTEFYMQHYAKQTFKHAVANSAASSFIDTSVMVSIWTLLMNGYPLWLAMAVGLIHNAAIFLVLLALLGPTMGLFHR